MGKIQLTLTGMKTSNFAKPTIEIAREQLTILLTRFGEVTGYPPTYVGKLARGEPKFARTYLENDFGFRSFDTVNQRLSALWPADAEWPVEVPRQAPATIEPEVLADIEARAEKARPKQEPAPAVLPTGEPWPEDIPRPATFPATNQEPPENG